MLILSVQERDAIMESLSAEQRDFLTKQLNRSRRTSFANAMARDKGFHIPDNTNPEDIEFLLSDWIYTGYIDAGCVSPELRCECGRQLRYQHQVDNKATGETKKFGIEHLKEHLGIDAEVVAAVKKGFDAIDYELDELLLKVKNGWQNDPEIVGRGNLPEDVRMHVSHGLPLLNRQLAKLRHVAPPRRAESIPIQRVVPVAEPPAPVDLFSWNAQEDTHENAQEDTALPVGMELDDRWHAPVLEYVGRGIRSARVICDLLIQEKGAADVRFLTGKPRFYPQVCLFIESKYPDCAVTTNGTEDRLYNI
ncbi:DUF3895 domain-containing protein [Cohnella yongneupensis]|uniref:DUF3895 domain-containing protein n=1 Tax=Cohnella yongneupensis TaxID=425006 RepID=A0ABW0QVK7_9BACL